MKNNPNLLYENNDISLEGFDGKFYRVSIFNENHWHGDILFDKNEILRDDLTDTKWISVKDKLPPNDLFVLVALTEPTSYHNKITIAYHDDVWRFENDCFIDKDETSVTHWMYLPKYPINK